MLVVDGHFYFRRTWTCWDTGSFPFEVVVRVKLFVLSALIQINFLDLFGVLILDPCDLGGNFDLESFKNVIVDEFLPLAVIYRNVVPLVLSIYLLGLINRLKFLCPFLAH